MKLGKKILTLILSAVMIMALGITAFADGTQTTNGTIAISNATSGKEYKAYKLFDATYAGDNISYTVKAGSVKNAINENAPFSVAEDADANGNYAVTLKDGKTVADITTWAKDIVEGLNASGTVIPTTDGEATINIEEAGYYYVTSGLGTVVTITTAKPDATIIDKNQGPVWHPEDPADPTDPEDTKGKMIKVGDQLVETADVNIGNTVTFVLKIDATNYVGEKQIKEYIISDSLPAGLTFGKITSVMVDNTDLTNKYEDVNLSTEKITIPWATENDGVWTSKYAANAMITVEYTATLNSSAAIDGNGNLNTASFNYNYTDHQTPSDPDTPDTPDGTSAEDTATVYTYALAIVKVNESGEKLSGATFKLPFKVSAVDGKENTYIVDTINGTDTVTTDSTGTITIIGVDAGTYEIEETVAPAGYNKLATKVIADAQKIGATTTNVTKYLDENGNVTETETAVSIEYTNTEYAATVTPVVNKAGTELPSTGGMGTTLIYVIGSVLVFSAGLILVTRRRMNNN